MHTCSTYHLTLLYDSLVDELLQSQAVTELLITESTGAILLVGKAAGRQQDRSEIVIEIEIILYKGKLPIYTSALL